MTRTAFAIFLVIGFLQPSCWPGTGNSGLGGGDCTEMGCNDSLAIDIERRDAEPFIPGHYTFTLSPPGETTFIVDCPLDEESSHLACSSNALSIETTINSSQDIFTVRILEAPHSILVTVEYGTQLLGEETLTPSYSMFNPNGVECEPTCFQGSATISVSAPQ